MRLNLGSADRLMEGYINVDIMPGPGVDQVADLSKPWPWPDSSVDEIAAYDVIEHLPNRIFTMNEMWRVLKPGGRAHIEVPNAAKGAGQHQDPTHVSAWCMNSWQYFQHQSFAHRRLARLYGIQAAFHVFELREREYQDVVEAVWKIHVTLEAVK